MIREFLRKRTLEQTFAFSTAFLVLILIGSTLLMARYRVGATLRASMVERGETIARSIGAIAKPFLLAYNYAALQGVAEGAATDEGVLYVVIQDKEGNLAAWAGGPAGGRDENGAVAEVVSGPESRDREVRTLDDEWDTVLEVAVPVYVGGAAEPWGSVRVGLSYEPMRAGLRHLELWLLALGLALALGAMICGRWVARRVTAPLRRLAVATESFAAGTMDRPIPEAGARELAELARAFNGMIERIQDQANESRDFQDRLEMLNQTLEEQVRQRTRALQESVAQYKTLVEHSPDAILIIQESRIRFMNRAFVDLFGVPAEEVLASGFDMRSILEPSSATLARGRIAAWERGEDLGAVEILGKGADGNVLHMQLRGSRIEYRGKSAAECILVDTTETRRLRDKLTDTERLRALGELAGGVAHDFNNQLGAVLGRVQLLRRRGFESGTDRELAVIEKAAQDGRETVRRIQEFARIRQDRQFFPVDLSEIILDALEITRSCWETDSHRRNVSVRVRTDTPSVPPVLGKDSELREVFTNLVLNAVDAMPQGGTLSLSCRHRGDHVIAEVQDTGVGMTDDIRRHLFDPFFTTKGQSGTGLGLSMVYGIVSRHDGEIDVESSLGKGTTFRLRFPVADEAEVARSVSEELEAEVSRAGRILVIDDERDIAEVLSETLAAEGHVVETALCGEDGVKMASLSTFDLVFTDLGMPDMSGWEVAGKIRENRPGIPVILVTGWGATLDEDEVRKHEISAVVHKPFELDDLIRTTASVLSRATPADGEAGSGGDLNPS